MVTRWNDTHDARKRQALRQAMAAAAKPERSWWAAPLTREQFAAEAKKAEERMNAASTNYRKPEEP